MIVVWVFQQPVRIRRSRDDGRQTNSATSISSTVPKRGFRVPQSSGGKITHRRNGPGVRGCGAMKGLGLPGTQNLPCPRKSRSMKNRSASRHRGQRRTTVARSRPARPRCQCVDAGSRGASGRAQHRNECRHHHSLTHEATRVQSRHPRRIRALGFWARCLCGDTGRCLGPGGVSGRCGRHTGANGSPGASAAHFRGAG